MRPLNCVLVVSGLAALALAQAQPEYGPDEVDRRVHMAKADRVYPGKPLASMRSFSESDELAAALRPTLVASALDAGSDLGVESLGALADHAAALLWHRFAQNDPRVYANWRLDAGYRWPNAGELRAWFIEEDWRFWFGDEPWPGRESVEEAWARYWNRWSDQGPALRVTALSTRAPAAAMATGVFTPEAPDSHPLFPETDDMAWGLAHTGGFRNWFGAPGPGVFELLKSDGRVVTARIGLLCEWNDGVLRPLYLLFHRDREGRWWLDGVSMTVLHGFTLPITEW